MLALVLTLALGIVLVPRSWADFLIADLSHHLVAITTGFVGSNVLLFGAVKSPGSEVAVVVRGPSSDLWVRRKSRIGPIWINNNQIEFLDVPEFYAVATSNPIEDLAIQGQLSRYDIGVGNLELTVNAETVDEGEDIDVFRDALIRNKQRAGLYPDTPGRVRFLGRRLFRTTLTFPANVPPGSYQIQTYEIEEGVVRNAQTTILTVSKVGMEAEIYELANNRAAIYGLMSIVLAVAAGWTASLVFRRR